MDATASGASSIAGRETVSKALRAYDTAPTASSHGFGREHAPALEATCEDVRGRSSRVVLTPGVCASSPAVMWRPTGARISHPQGDGGNSASLPGESTKYAVNHRAGKAGRSAHLWSTPVCIFFAHGLTGASRRPAFPAPLSFMRATRRSKARAQMPREREGVSAMSTNCLLPRVQIYNRHPEVRAQGRIAPPSKPRRATARL
ncbi:hypothetical protein GGD64_000176 [Bradyrhizobium sp. CIR3A]|nr:hypothetical protein [Bradyrhizobium sp. CIR3A]